jgi:hypothetical protein
MDTQSCPIVAKRLKSPAVVAFVSVSLFLGILIIFATPPLRGPDETAHFLRAYGIAQGDLVPSLRDVHNRKGLFIPPRLFEGFDFFESTRIKEKEVGFRYGPVFEAYSKRAAVRIDSDQPHSFVPYAGSERYSPVAYLPQAAAALVARGLDLGFLPTLYMMRLAGLFVLTSVIAYAIAIVPNLSWAFFAIAMLPAAIYGRSVINADGSTLATALVVTALWLRGILSSQLTMPRTQSLLMTLCSLPPKRASPRVARISPYAISCRHRDRKSPYRNRAINDVLPRHLFIRRVLLENTLPSSAHIWN